MLPAGSGNINVNGSLENPVLVKNECEQIRRRRRRCIKALACI